MCLWGFRFPYFWSMSIMMTLGVFLGIGIFLLVIYVLKNSLHEFRKEDKDNYY